MSFFGQIAFGQILGAVVGGLFGNRAAKHQGAADRYAVDQQMAPFRLKEPFLRDLYSGASGALDALATGAFTGSTYAGLDPMQMRGITGMGAFGDRHSASARRSWTWARVCAERAGHLQPDTRSNT